MLHIDDCSLNKARKVGGFRTKKKTVNQTVAEFLRHWEQRAIGDLLGTRDFPPNFNLKKLRLDW